MKGRAALFAAALLAAASAAAQPAIPDAFARADKGHCLACHALPAALARPGGDMGPALGGTRMRELGNAGLAAVLEDPMAARSNTVMPPFGKHHILDAAETQAIARFLLALPDGDPAFSEPATEPGDDAAAAAVLERGRTLWTRKFKDKRSLSGCFPNGGRRLAVAYPQYDARVKRVMTLEMAVNQCLKAHHESLLDPLDADMGAILAYVHSLSEGLKVNVRVPQAAQSRFDEGKRLYFTRLGQRNFACASCHVQSAGKRYDGTVLSPLAGQAARAASTRAGKPFTLQARMRECLERMGAAPFAAGSDELNHLEYFVTQQSNGVALRGARPR